MPPGNGGEEDTQGASPPRLLSLPFFSASEGVREPTWLTLIDVEILVITHRFRRLQVNAEDSVR